MSRKVATITVRGVPLRVVKGLKAMARRANRSMEQEVRELLEEHVAERASILRQLESSWARQSRRATPEELEEWIASGRE